MAMERIWDKILPLLLPQNYRLITFDWPFAGTVKDQNLYDPVKYSSVEGFADDLITLLNKMDLKAVTFVGHSMSGMIGCIASVKSPQLFKTLILVGASPSYHLILFLNFYLLVCFVTLALISWICSTSIVPYYEHDQLKEAIASIII
ncbi:putative strigolactone esterase DAD2 [Glycine soja]|uniref:Putative strigolactone esterase DAD2 n=1 Tax=Glycine soja TaxID=3848 RepID=A0A445KTD4_GLYSO|nr:putative strigolactone esterase DAD2 [Glycine soja]